MSRLIPSYIEQALRIEHLERELSEAKAEIVRLNGEAVAKSERVVPEFELIEKWEGE
tara:strand:+ start:630 stop:800 length:171 start_codon:yes stop_codon:yes gene_type:complete